MLKSRNDIKNRVFVILDYDNKLALFNDGKFGNFSFIAHDTLDLKRYTHIKDAFDRVTRLRLNVPDREFTVVELLEDAPYLDIVDITPPKKTSPEFYFKKITSILTKI